MSLRHAVLATLLPGPQSGYDLAKKFDDVMRTVWYARRNQMYGELAKLTEAGFAREVAEGPAAAASTWSPRKAERSCAAGSWTWNRTGPSATKPCCAPS
ncbi:hypothetical protein GCM10029964_027470 [Kibdelosporangium lantanae]